MKRISHEEGYQVFLKTFRYVWKSMSLTLLILASATTNLHAEEGASQTKKVSIVTESSSFRDVLLNIEKQTDYLFIYAKSEIDLDKKVSINAQDKPVTDVLNTILRNTDIEYAVEGNNIMLMKKAKPLAAAAASPTLPIRQQSGKTITGTVLDTGNVPIIGANVIEKGTTNGNITDADGHFTLTVRDGAILVVSYIGYTSREVAVGNQQTITIQLSEDTQALDEIVVVGYSTQRRESLTGALQTLKNEKIVTAANASVVNLLANKAPGVYVAPGSGQPGSQGNIIIRGKSSVNGEVNPLWVIDGVIVGTSANYTLNPNDIETLTILKDAASTAIYGSQGANGVIVVTTKTASPDKFTISVSSKFGVNNLDNGNLEVMNGAELYDYFKSFSNQDMITFPRWNENLRNSNYDWWNLAIKTGFAQDYNVSISGGSEKVKSYFSLGYYEEEGAVRGYDFSRYSMRHRTEYKPFRWLTVKTMVTGSRRDVTDQQYSVSGMYSNLPWDSPYLEDGSPTPNYSSTWVNSNKTNYLYDLQWNRSENRRYSFMGNFDFDIRLNDWLTFSSINNFTWDNYAAHAYTDPRSNAGSGVTGRIEEDDQKTERRYTNQILRFNRSFGKHSLNALAAYEFSDYRYKNLEADATGFVAGFEVLDVTAKPEKTGGLINESAIQSFLFNANYAYDNKYLAQVSARRDGASNFGNNAKYGNFFSVSGGWNINKEAFFQADWVDLLKLRMAYGSVGNRPSSLYPQYDMYNVSEKYKEISGALISQIGNKDLTWEKTYTLGIGVDFSFLERFRVNFDYYNKYTDNILFRVPVSGITGVTSIWQNVGEMDNNGFEIVLGADIIKSKDWNWTVDFNLGLNRNKIKKLYGDEENVKGIVTTNFGGPAGSISRILLPGNSSDTYFTREWAGVNPDTGAPQWYKTDASSNSRVITETYAEADEVMYGSYNPDFFGGFLTGLSWKQIDVNAVVGYSVGGLIYNYARQEYDSDGTYTDRNQMKLMKSWSRWEAPGDVATHPKPAYNNASNANKVSSRYLEDAGYLKLRSVSIGYNLQLPQWKIQSLRLSFSAENLFTITDYSGVDPEIPVNSGTVTGVTTASNGYPITRKFMFGINFTL
ncbi:MAG: TonB-dependent receptor [Tannerellaceae bacterium]|jgi:TonB-linked SusC/RagA family outer membrane protein|nr:TonB-dependent receptor [Tannerellaceae bacterium]